MKPAWDQLMSEYAGSKSTGIYDVDCTTDGKDLCEEVGVSGYPTIKYGDASDKKALTAYDGGRDLESLKKFAEEKLGPVCGPASMDACSEEDKALLEGFLKRSSADLTVEVKELDKEFTKRQKKVDKSASKLKERRREFQDDFDEFSGSKPKKGKEAEHKAKSDKLEKRRAKLDEEQASIDKENDGIKSDLAKKGVKLMKLAAKANKDRTDL
jgi:hypothetical protein